MSESSAPPRRLNWKAVLAGFAFKYIGARVFDVGVWSLMALGMASRGVPAASIAAELSSSTAYLLTTFVISNAFAVAGAYLAAHLTPEDEMRHAMLVGFASLLFNTALFIWRPAAFDGDAVWFAFLPFVMALPNAWLGGYLRRRRPRYAPIPASTPRPPIPEA